MSITTKNKIKREFGGSSGDAFLTNFKGGTFSFSNLNHEATLILKCDRLNYSGPINVELVGLPENVFIDDENISPSGVIDIAEFLVKCQEGVVNGNYECMMVVSGGGTIKELPFNINVVIGA